MCVIMIKHIQSSCTFLSWFDIHLYKYVTCHISQWIKKPIDAKFWSKWLNHWQLVSSLNGSLMIPKPFGTLETLCSSLVRWRLITLQMKSFVVKTYKKNFKIRLTLPVFRLISKLLQFLILCHCHWLKSNKCTAKDT